MGADEADRAHHNDQDNCEHHCVFGDVLTVIFFPESAKQGSSHLRLPQGLIVWGFYPTILGWQVRNSVLSGDLACLGAPSGSQMSTVPCRSRLTVGGVFRETAQFTSESGTSS